MNLIPIDAGAVAPEPTGVGSTQAEGDFAALMSALMSGDAQIAPAIDVPLTTEEPEDTADGDSDIEAEVGTMLELIGSPPAGPLPASPDLGDAELSDGPDSVPATAAPILYLAPAEYSQPRERPATEDPSSTAQPASGVDPMEGELATPAALASVHPITSGGEPGVDGRIDTTQGEPNGGVATGQPAATVGQPPISTATEDSSPTEPTKSPATPPSSHVVAGAGASAASVDQAIAATVVSGPPDDKPIRDPETRAEHVEVPPVGAEPELEAASGVRGTESPGRPPSIPGGPVMVGIARRVEAAITALATKPDPKIVTLQLDELDGVRLTVALRPDGIHLSSTGEASLTADLERALASRGFEMASDARQRHQEPAQESADDSWKPQTASHRRRTNQPGITL